MNETEELALEFAKMYRFENIDSLNDLLDDYREHYINIAKHVQRMVLDAKIDTAQRLYDQLRRVEHHSVGEEIWRLTERLAELRSERNRI